MNMKKRVLFATALAGLMLGACSSSDDLNGGASSESNISYLAVNISGVSEAPATRADGTYKDDKNKGDYEDGTDAENKIEKVRFYFFATNGAPYVFQDGKSYKDVKAPELDSPKEDHNATVASKTKAILLLDGTTTEKPAYMLAVVNPDICESKALKNGANLNWKYARREATGETWKASDNSSFVMSNSTYSNMTQDICTTQLTGSIFTGDEGQKKAEANPVNVYVERVVAKVQASVNKTNFGDRNVLEGYTNAYSIKVGEMTETNSEGVETKHDIYAWIQGWGLADEDSEAELTKQIDTKWNDDDLGISPWTTADYHRCFWSNSVNNANLLNHAFNDYKAKEEQPLYTLPHTPTTPLDDQHLYDNKLTKLLVACYLGYEDNGQWKRAEICEFKGQTLLGVDNVKSLVLQPLTDYKVKKGENTFEGLTKNDITFVTSSSYNSNLKDYEVVPALASNITSLYKEVNGKLTELTNDEMANILKELAKAPCQIRPQGATYYFTTIKHLGSKGKLGEYGIVRNHSYKITIDNIKGFGTPVYDPDKTIIPTLPTNDKSYMAAKINVLSWRVVNSSVDLDKTQK